MKTIAVTMEQEKYEALQFYLILWQIMCMEQAPNPYAFSVGNADRIFEPYRNELTREEAAEGALSVEEPLSP